MSTPYTPSPVQLTTVTVPDDGDARVAASVSLPIEEVADGVAYVSSMLKMQTATFTSSGNWTAPAGCTHVILTGYGGGGGGGTGVFMAFSTTNTWAPGGGGGGAAIQSSQCIPVTPGTTYAVSVGAGGISVGGLIGGVYTPDNGGDGGDTVFGGGLARFRGASGGRFAVASVVASSYAGAAGGAPCVRPAGLVRSALRHDPSLEPGVPDSTSYGPGFGGEGWDNQSGGPDSNNGWDSVQGWSGGGGGSQGNDSGSYRGGGGGGGGAAGPGGAGGNGGHGGNANSAGVGSGATPGLDGAPNTGAGGGGAGQVGSCTGFTVGPISGAGGSGKLTITYVASV